MVAVTLTLLRGFRGGEQWDTVPLASEAAIVAAVAVIGAVAPAADRLAARGGLGDGEVWEAGTALRDTAVATGTTPTAVGLNALGGGLDLQPQRPGLRALEEAVTSLAAHSW